MLIGNEVCAVHRLALRSMTSMRFMCSVFFVLLVTVDAGGSAVFAEGGKKDECAPDGTSAARVMQAWAGRCAHELCGKVVRMPSTARSDLKPKRPHCRHGDLSELLGLIRDTHERGGIVFLGEVHDNPTHHDLRAHLLSRPPKSPGRGAIVFEQIRKDQQRLVDKFNAGPVGSENPDAVANRLFDKLDWSKGNWPDQKIYRPLFSEALRLGLKVVGGDAVRDKIKNVARKGLEVLQDNERSNLKLDDPLDGNGFDVLLSELENSHCGMMPKTALTGIAMAQRYRDASLAEAAVKARADAGSVTVIAGNGHVRTDRGSPWYVEKFDADEAAGTEKQGVLAVLLEEEPGEGETPAQSQSRQIADFVIYTPRQARPDPCEQMRKHMQGKRHKKTE